MTSVPLIVTSTLPSARRRPSSAYWVESTPSMTMESMRSESPDSLTEVAGASGTVPSAFAAGG